MVNFPTLAFGTIAKYKDMLALLEKNSQAPEILQRVATGTMRVAREAVEAVGITPSATLEGLGRDNSHLLGETYYTQAAIRYGEHVAKLSIAPKSENVRSLTGRRMKVEDFSGIRDVLVDYFRSEGAEYELRAQLSTDVDAMPVEDTAVLWKEEDSLHRPVATLRIEPQDAYTPERRIYGDDVLTFNPWNGVQAHQPLAPSCASASTRTSVRPPTGTTTTSGNALNRTASSRFPTEHRRPDNQRERASPWLNIQTPGLRTRAGSTRSNASSRTSPMTHRRWRRLRSKQ